VTVGVAYGTDTREVSRLMLKAAHDHERTLKDPEPFVLFTEFRDNSLVFEVYFWLSMGRLMDVEGLKVIFAFALMTFSGRRVLLSHFPSKMCISIPPNRLICGSWSQGVRQEAL